MYKVLLSKALYISMVVYNIPECKLKSMNPNCLFKRDSSHFKCSFASFTSDVIATKFAMSFKMHKVMYSNAKVMYSCLQCVLKCSVLSF